MSTCKHCKFYQPFAPDKGVDGECRRNAPHPSAIEHRAVWPRTYADDWCSQFAVLAAGAVRPIPSIAEQVPTELPTGPSSKTVPDPRYEHTEPETPPETT